MNWKCLFGFHQWKKWGGYINAGNGRFKQSYICERCKKMKVVIS